MSQSPPFIQDATPENFTALVLSNSDKGLVLVNYWSPQAGPCLRLWPVLERLAGEFQGRFLLANLNVVRHPHLAREYGVTSVPTLKLFRHGAVQETVHGYDSEGSLRTLINRHLSRPSDRAIAQAVQRYQQGQAADAFALLERAAAEDPENARIPITHAKLLIQSRDYAAAEVLLHALPRAAWDSAEDSALLAHLSFLLASQSAPAAEDLEQFLASNPEDCDTRYTLAAVKLSRDDYEGAMDQLVEILRRDRGFRDGVAVRGLSAIFQLLGKDDQRVRRCRERLLDMSD